MMAEYYICFDVEEVFFLFLFLSFLFSFFMMIDIFVRVSPDFTDYNKQSDLPSSLLPFLPLPSLPLFSPSFSLLSFSLFLFRFDSV